VIAKSITTMRVAIGPPMSENLAPKITQKINQILSLARGWRKTAITLTDQPGL